MATLDQVQVLAAAQGLTVARSPRWGQVSISAADGRILTVCGRDAAPAWIAGYAIGRASVKSCPNPECRGGFVGGEDPHPCGQC